MKNIPSSNGSSGFSRNFTIDKQIMSLFSHNTVIQASFFDLYDDVSAYFRQKAQYIYILKYKILNFATGLFGYAFGTKRKNKRYQRIFISIDCTQKRIIR